MQINGNKEAQIILRTLAYYDIFDYPLTEEDIFSYCDQSHPANEQFKDVLLNLVEKGVVYKMGEFYGLRNIQQHVTDRIDGNKRAENWYAKARWFSRLIASFPFVRGIALSGSLSKGVIGDNPDIDYFIITHPNRLWLTRTLLVLFKKVFLLNSYKYFCINYFVDTNHLEIEEKNLFTATEVITLIPTYGTEVTGNFFEQNRWIHQFYPNFRMNGQHSVYNPGSQPLKRTFEFFLGSKIGDWLDNKFMNITIKHWYKKFSHQFPEEDFNLVFKSSKTISKHHPRNFQKKVLEAFKSRVHDLDRKHNIQLEETFTL
ncbi:MAG: hypothetical protein KDC05_04095 [Bacteroidales bacterium]|nr:hypothetical protein [Bacteroidales bacterium]